MLRNRVSTLRLTALAIVANLVIQIAATGWENSPATAFQKSETTRRPLFIVATKTTCAPCQRMKRSMEESQSLQQTLDDCVVLSVDADQPQFQKVARRFGIPGPMVPLIYLVRPDGTLAFSHSGALEADQISAVIESVARETSKVASASEEATTDNLLAESKTSNAELEAALLDIRQLARDGKLLLALRQVAPIARGESKAREVRRAKHYQSQLERAIGDWIVDLDHRMASGDQEFEAAYQIAKICASAPRQFTGLRSHSRELLDIYESRDGTRIAVRQAKHLVRAREAENRHDCSAALENYLAVRRISPSSPAGKFAAKRIPTIRKRRELKLTNAS